MARVLGAVRESRTTDESTSVERQTERITLWAKMMGHEVVKVTADTDTSGKVSPFEREQLGPWLTERTGLWDILVTTKLDRITRSVRDFADLIQWCEEHGKIYVSINESVDLSTSAGRMMANVIVAFAQYERELISERQLDSRRALRNAGRYSGSRPPYGYRPHDTGRGHVLVQDAKAAKIIHDMVAMAKDGKSNNGIAIELNRREIPSPKGGEWAGDSVRFVLNNPALMGQSWRKDGTLVRDSAGKPVTFTDDPIITADEFAVLQAALRTRSNGPVERKNGHQLRQVLFCGQCSRPMYGTAETHRRYAYYRCLRCSRPNAVCVPKPATESEAERLFLDAAGLRPIMRKVTIPGDDHGREISRLEAQLETVRDIALIDTAPLEAELERLRAMPHEADIVMEVQTGESVASVWEALDTMGRGDFLRTHGVRFHGSRDGIRLVSLGDLAMPEPAVQAG
jgi:site-specific DNA recombinase